MTLLHLLIIASYVSISVVYSDSSDDSTDSNDDVCDTETRHRKPWQLLSKDEKANYVDGFQYLRKNKVLAKITKGHNHQNNEIFLHDSSLNFYWHSYVLYELETAFRNLGGKFKCFSLPYWDCTLDAGLEDNPTVLDSGIGTNGEIANDYCISNDKYFADESGFNWHLPNVEHPRHSDLSFYWSPQSDFCADSEEYPMCCLKRWLSSTTTLYSAVEVGQILKNRKSVYNYNYYVSMAHAKIHKLFGGNGVAQFAVGQATDDPLFFIFHAFIEYLRMMYMTCHDYDDINTADLDDYPNVYHGFCAEVGVWLTKKECQNMIKSRGVELDDPMIFWELNGLDGAVCAERDISVRDMFNPSDWNVQYELGPFYETSATDLWCSKDDLNSDWFVETMTDTDGTDMDGNEISPVNSYILQEKEKMLADGGYSTDDIMDALASKSCKFVRENSENSCWDESMDYIEIENCDDLTADQLDDMTLDDLLNKQGISENECLQKVRSDSWEFASKSWWGRATKRMLCNGQLDYPCDDWVDPQSDTYSEEMDALKLKAKKYRHPDEMYVVRGDSDSDDDDDDGGMENDILIDVISKDYNKKSEQTKGVVIFALFAFVAVVAALLTVYYGCLSQKKPIERKQAIYGSFA